jgi:hypothetical protein
MADDPNEEPQDEGADTPREAGPDTPAGDEDNNP